MFGAVLQFSKVNQHFSVAVLVWDVSGWSWKSPAETSAGLISPRQDLNIETFDLWDLL